MVVRASGCVSLLLYVLLYEADVQAAEQLGQTPTRSLSSPALASSSRSQRARSPTTTVMLSDLPRTVRGRPLASAGVCGGCYSFSYSPAKEAPWWWPRAWDATRGPACWAGDSPKSARAVSYRHDQANHSPNKDDSDNNAKAPAPIIVGSPFCPRIPARMPIISPITSRPPITIHMIGGVRLAWPPAAKMGMTNELVGGRLSTPAAASITVRRSSMTEHRPLPFEARAYRAEHADGPR
jgi:hypothetical protein